MMEDDLAPPQARDCFGLALEQVITVERAILDGILYQEVDVNIVPQRLRWWLKSELTCE